jgi:uncharacterized membrane protein
LVISGDVSLSDPTYHFQDFSVDGLVLSDENPTEGDQISISATVRNSGNIPGAGLEYRILVDDKPIVKDTIAVLNAGQTTQVLGTWTALRGNHVAKVEVDYRGYLLEINEDNNTVVMGFGVNHFDMVTRVDPELQEVQPGMNATFKIEIENAGTLDDSFGIVITGPPVGFEFDLGADSADVDVLKKAIISLVVRTPSQAVAGTMATADITITSQGNTTHLSTVTATTRIKKLTGFEMTPIGDTEAYIDPRGNHEFDINVSNIGNAIDTVYIKNDITNPGWMVMTNATNMKLQPYEHQLLKLTVTPPYQPQGGDYVLVTLDGETTSGLTATLSFMVTVMDIHNISLSTVIEDSEVDPGGDLQAQIVMNNFGNNDESIEMYADVPDGWEALFDEDVPFILAYGAMEDFMTLEVPKDALAGDYNISIGAVGEYTEYEEVFTVTVGQKYGVEVDISPSRNSVKQKEKTSFTLKVTNSGNGEDTFDMHLIGAPSSMRISFDEDVIAVGPYDIGTVRISIEAMNTAPGTYSLTVEAVSQGNKAKSSSASFQVQVIEVSSTNNNNNNNNNNNTQIIDDPDDNDSSLFGTYGPYILVGLIALMVIILLTAVALRHRSKKAEELDSMPPPMEGDMGPPPGGAPTTYGQVDQMGPSAPLPGPGPRPPVDDGPLMERSIEEGPASETPRPSPPDQGMEGAMEPTPSEMPHEGHPPVQPPPPPPPPPPPIQDMGRPQEPAGPSTGTEGPDPSTSGQDQPVEKEKASGDDIDNMISNLMGKLD